MVSKQKKKKIAQTNMKFNVTSDFSSFECIWWVYYVHAATVNTVLQTHWLKIKEEKKISKPSSQEFYVHYLKIRLK